MSENSDQPANAMQSNRPAATAPVESKFLKLPLEIRLMIYEQLFTPVDCENDWYDLIQTNKQIYNEVASIIHKAQLFVHIPTASSFIGQAWADETWEEEMSWARSAEHQEEPHLRAYFAQFKSVILEIGVGSRVAWEQHERHKSLDAFRDEITEMMMRRWTGWDAGGSWENYGGKFWEKPELEIQFYFDCDCAGCYRRGEYRALVTGGQQRRGRLTALVTGSGSFKEAGGTLKRLTYGMMIAEDQRRRNFRMVTYVVPSCKQTGKYVLPAFKPPVTRTDRVGFLRQDVKTWEAHRGGSCRAKPMQTEGFSLR